MLADELSGHEVAHGLLCAFSLFIVGSSFLMRSQPPIPNAPHLCHAYLVSFLNIFIIMTFLGGAPNDRLFWCGVVTTQE